MALCSSLPFKSDACLHDTCLSAYVCPLVFASFLLFVVGLCFSAADSVSSRGLCERNPGRSLFQENLPWELKAGSAAHFPDVRTRLLEVGLWVVSVTVVILRDLTAG